MAAARARILIASDVTADADMLRQLLQGSYPNVTAATEPGSLVAEFDRHRPQVLVLAFKNLETSERLYLGLYRHSAQISLTPHRTLLLCSKDDLQRAYELCIKGNFDDYVLFWPMVHDAMRLAMSVHLALCALDGHRAAATMVQLAAQSRRIAELEALLDRQLELGSAHAERARESLQAAQTQVGAALGDFSRRVLETGLDKAVNVIDPGRVRAEISRLSDAAVAQPAGQTLQPVQQWMGALKTELASPLQASRMLGQHARGVRPLLLVVDDEDFMRKVLARVLGAAHYDVEVAASATEAMAVLRNRRPDLILTDVQMPDIDGIELTRWLKAGKAYAAIPVIMLTGHGEKDVIVDSLGAGAADFIVKPFDREILLKKVAHHLRT